MNYNRRYLTLLLLLLVGQTGCQHYGPRSIMEDRLKYNHAIAESWKEQALLNIVKMRHMDPLFFVDVPQITSGYTLQGTGSAIGGIYPPTNPAASIAQQLGLNVSLQGAYQDRPTISYAPQTGSQFIRNLTTPINPGSVLYLLQSGYPADVVFNLTVDSINGVRNRSFSGGQLRPADPEFTRVVQIIRKAQIAGHVGIRVEQDKDKRDSVAFFFRDADVAPDLALELAWVRKTLRLDTERRDFRVVFGGTPSSPNEIAILSRSVIRIIAELAGYVDGPVAHQDYVGATSTTDAASSEPQMFRVYCGAKKPMNPFTSVCYENHWYWIDKSDFYSKRTMGYLLILLALADTGAKENLPVITIQAN